MQLAKITIRIWTIVLGYVKINRFRISFIIHQIDVVLVFNTKITLFWIRYRLCLYCFKFSSRVTLRQKGKSNVKSIYFQNIRALKKKYQTEPKTLKMGPNYF
jgi:hypothetical protein